MLHRYSLILPAPDADRGATGGLGTAADAPAPADDVKVVVRRVPPSVDRDGNELSGIRLPDVTVPLATYTGWNLRHPQIGAPERLMSLIGSTIPFPATEGQRAAKGDPRRSIAARYPGKAAYLTSDPSGSSAAVWNALRATAPLAPVAANSRGEGGLVAPLFGSSRQITPCTTPGVDRPESSSPP
jgi:hypothetical protein